jgi:hypothetical protein
MGDFHSYAKLPEGRRVKDLEVEEACMETSMPRGHFYVRSTNNIATILGLSKIAFLARLNDGCLNYKTSAIHVLHLFFPCFSVLGSFFSLHVKLVSILLLCLP